MEDLHTQEDQRQISPLPVSLSAAERPTPLNLPRRRDVEQRTGLPHGNSKRRWHGTSRMCRLGDDDNNRDFCNAPGCSICRIIEVRSDHYAPFPLESDCTAQFLSGRRLSNWSVSDRPRASGGSGRAFTRLLPLARCVRDRKSTRLNSSHSGESRMPSSA